MKKHLILLAFCDKIIIYNYTALICRFLRKGRIPRECGDPEMRSGQAYGRRCNLTTFKERFYGRKRAKTRKKREENELLEGKINACSPESSRNPDKIV